jgi:hypothetical protein
MIEGPIQTNNSGLVFYFDTKEPKSYVGEPTTNLNQQVSNYTGTGYSSDGEWLSDPTRFTKTYDASIITPIGFGATLCTESGTAGFHHLSRMGGGGESGTHSISCYVKPLNSITNFTIGMLGDGGNQVSFNLSTKAITYGGAISNRNAFCIEVSGFPGWLYVGANIEGRAGGWVGCVGISTSSSYTPTAPYKAFYITGLQYEYKAAPTKFTVGTRSNTQGLLDLTGGSTIDLTNAGYNASSEITFNGSSNYITTPTINLGNAFTVSAWFNSSAVSGDSTIVGTDANGCDNWLGVYNGYLYGFVTQSTDINNFTFSGATALSNNQWYHGTIVVNGNTATLYLNGKQDYTTTTAFTIGAWNGVFSIGRRCPAVAQRFFNGKIETVSMYNRALSASEILKNFNSQRSRYSV